MASVMGDDDVVVQSDEEWVNICETKISMRTNKSSRISVNIYHTRARGRETQQNDMSEMRKLTQQYKVWAYDMQCKLCSRSQCQLIRNEINITQMHITHAHHKQAHTRTTEANYASSYQQLTLLLRPRLYRHGRVKKSRQQSNAGNHNTFQSSTNSHRYTTRPTARVRDHPKDITMWCRRKGKHNRNNDITCIILMRKKNIFTMKNN